MALQMQADGDKERWSKVPPLQKNFYKEDPAVAAMPDDEVARVRAEMNDVHVSCDEKDAPLPNPVTTFEQAFAAYPEILDELVKVGFEKPTPIQAQGWPVLLSGQDMIGIAQTGSGKTLAFLLPALIHTDLQPIPREERGGPNVLVLAPTRELALQTEKEVKRYNYKGIRSVCVYGGGDRRTQVKAVCSGVEIIIATPGRLNDLVQAGFIDVTSVTYLVLDEADRMLDMGFEPEIRKVLLDIRPDRQTVMTSATWPVDVRRIADKYMQTPIHVVVGTLDLQACRTVEQIIVFCRDEEEKKEKLDEYLYNMGPDEKIIVFFGRKAKASQLSIDYGVNGVDLQSIHGDRPQEEREIAIEDMQSGSCRVLFATDVASRGIDIADVTLIVNFDFPRHIEDYVHRVGRTGRAGKTGRAVTFMVREDWRHAAELIEILQKNQAEVPDWLVEMSERFSRMKERRAGRGAQDLELSSDGSGTHTSRSGGQRYFVAYPDAASAPEVAERERQRQAQLIHYVTALTNQGLHSDGKRRPHANAAAEGASTARPTTEEPSTIAVSAEGDDAAPSSTESDAKFSDSLRQFTESLRRLSVNSAESTTQDVVTKPSHRRQQSHAAQENEVDVDGPHNLPDVESAGSSPVVSTVQVTTRPLHELYQVLTQTQGQNQSYGPASRQLARLEQRPTERKVPSKIELESGFQPIMPDSPFLPGVAPSAPPPTGFEAVATPGPSGGTFVSGPRKPSRLTPGVPPGPGAVTTQRVVGLGNFAPERSPFRQSLQARPRSPAGASERVDTWRHPATVASTLHLSRD
ncbi:probable ATP-dependent RNA helicase DDX43 [Pollicipes pollicipes]|uniref:probable ATP-dependent RNA helicase DDX43 n=1 Tax=Pollicipes pollicipes TaxID=41117 RepID=UPI0018852EF9|nr:probable ATP-dependent RNA helicase DDX43 [Pollicipes pollicipes]